MHDSETSHSINAAFGLQFATLQFGCGLDVSNWIDGTFLINSLLWTIIDWRDIMENSYSQNH